MLAGRDVLIKGLDVQVRSGKQTSFSEGKLVKEKSENAESNANLQSLMCLITHVWKVNQDSNSSLQGIDSILHRRTFSILGDQDRIVWKFNFN